MKESPPSTHKKVVIRKLDKGLVKGYVNPAASLGPTGIEVLEPEGRLVNIPLEEIKGIYYVRDFEGNRQRPERKVFHSRPRLGGLWIRMTFKDNEVLEGLLANNLLELEQHGFLITPPDLYSNNLKIFVPRTALAGLEVLGVISDGTLRRTSRQASRSRRKPADAAAQIDLFHPQANTEAK